MARKAKPLRWPVADWAPLNEAFARVKAALGSSYLALHDLHDDLRSGCLPSGLRSIGRDGVETSGDVKAEFWQRVTLSEWLDGDPPKASGKIHLRFFDPKDVPRFESWHFFVARRELDKLYPIARLNDAKPRKAAAATPRPQDETPKRMRKTGGGRRRKFTELQQAWLQKKYRRDLKADPRLEKQQDAAVPHVQDLAKTKFKIAAGPDTLLKQIIRPVLRDYFSKRK